MTVFYHTCSKKKWCGSSILCTHPHSSDESNLHRSWWTFSIESFKSNLTQLTAQHLSAGNSSLRPTAGSKSCCSGGIDLHSLFSMLLLEYHSFTCVRRQFRGYRNVVCVLYWMLSTEVSKIIVIYVIMSMNPYKWNSNNIHITKCAKMCPVMSAHMDVAINLICVKHNADHCFTVWQLYMFSLSCLSCVSTVM